MRAIIAYFLAVVLAGVVLAGALGCFAGLNCGLGVSIGHYTASFQGWCLWN